MSWKDRESSRRRSVRGKKHSLLKRRSDKSELMKKMPAASSLKRKTACAGKELRKRMLKDRPVLKLKRLNDRHE